ncbi:MAG: TetR/AcrR family transcriptional regulator [Actinomycetota bacterium]|nr:TetR/AcrR family transcriptional regulator [Actinomycetota bacterium]
MTTHCSGSGDLTRSLELLWGTREQPTRGPKPGLSLAAIVAKAVEVADADGLPAVSMRRIADELGVGTMSLYRHVPGKAELLDLMLDSVAGEPSAGRTDADPPPLTGGGWRASLEEFARGAWAQFHRHPWLLQVSQARPIMGPNEMLGTEAILAAIAEMGLSDGETVAVLSTVYAYVSGLARNNVEYAKAASTTGVSDEDWWGAQAPFLEKVIASGDYPHLTRVSEAGAWESTDDGFEFGLKCVFDGIEAQLRSRSVAAEPDQGQHARGANPATGQASEEENG